MSTLTFWWLISLTMYATTTQYTNPFGVAANILANIGLIACLVISFYRG